MHEQLVIVFFEALYLLIKYFIKNHIVLDS